MNNTEKFTHLPLASDHEPPGIKPERGIPRDGGRIRTVKRYDEATTGQPTKF